GPIGRFFLVGFRTGCASATQRGLQALALLLLRLLGRLLLGFLLRHNTSSSALGRRIEPGHRPGWVWPRAHRSAVTNNTRPLTARSLSTGPRDVVSHSEGSDFLALPSGNRPPIRVRRQIDSSL